MLLIGGVFYWWFVLLVEHFIGVVFYWWCICG